MTAFVHTIFTWLGLMSLAFCIAVLVFRLPVFIPSIRVAPYRDDIFDPGIWPLLGIALALIIASSVPDMLLRAAEMSERPIQAVFPALSTVLLRTHYGTVWLIRIASLALLLMLMPIVRKRRGSYALRYCMLILGVVIAWTESASGHASDQGDFTLREMTDLFHILAACIWGGGVLVLSLVILPSLLKQGDMIAIAEISRRFSRMAGFAVLVIAATAFYNVRTYVGGFGALWKTNYGLTVAAKMVLLYFLLLLGGFNRYVSVPLLQHMAGTRLEGPGIISRIAAMVFDRFRGYLSGHIGVLFNKILLIETMFMMAVLLCAALLKHETPASHLEHKEHEQREHREHAGLNNINSTQRSAAVFMRSS